MLEFWFGRPPLRPNGKLWWGGKSQDGVIRERFSGAVADALRGSLDSWASEPRGALALVILLDQMTRNIYRGQPQAFAGDARALEITQSGLAQGIVDQYHPYEAVFFLMPLEHHESLVSQDRCIREMEALSARCGDDELEMVRSCLGYARQHRDIIHRFGRYPHRNEVLGRQSSQEEQDYLGSGGRRFGQ